MNRKKPEPIFVTKPSMPAIEDYRLLLEDIWSSGYLTNNGPMVKKLEIELSKAMKIQDFVAINNGTSAIQAAIKALNLKGEVITTPFTWIATVSAIKAEGCEPVFCDIDPETLNIDPKEIEASITEKTVAILPVHVFGNPCDAVAIEKIAERHNLKVIYDAAHAMGTTLNNQSVLRYGDISATSLHATKLFSTVEGGGCISDNEDIMSRIRRIRNFGLKDQYTINEDGFNGKMSEVHAAFGLANLPNLANILHDRKEKYHHYLKHLDSVENLRFQKLNGDGCNYSYFPLMFEEESTLHEVLDALKCHEIFPRRYFYPALTESVELPSTKPMPIAEDIARRILCLPLYHQLSFQNIDFICGLICSTVEHRKAS